MEILNNKYEVKYIDERYIKNIRVENIRVRKKETKKLIWSYFRHSNYRGHCLESELKEIKEFKDNNIICFLIMSLVECFKNIDSTSGIQYKREEEKYNKIFDSIKEIIIKERK